MKKYVFFTVISMSLFLTSCSNDDLNSSQNSNDMEQIDTAPIILDDFADPSIVSIPPKTKDKDD